MITCIFGLTACGSETEYTDYEQQKVEIIQSPGVVPVTGTVTAGLQTAEILQNPGNEADHTQEERQEVIKTK